MYVRTYLQGREDMIRLYFYPHVYIQYSCCLAMYKSCYIMHVWCYEIDILYGTKNNKCTCTRMHTRHNEFPTLHIMCRHLYLCTYIQVCVRTNLISNFPKYECVPQTGLPFHYWFIMFELFFPLLTNISLILFFCQSLRPKSAYKSG